MAELSSFLIDAFPEAAVLVRRWRVERANAMARHYLPSLQEGEPLPQELRPLLETGEGTGTFASGLSTYAFRRVTGETGGEMLLLFRPAPQTALTDMQLDGALRQLRQLLGELMTQCGGKEAAGGAVQKSLHRMFRLVDNLDFLRANAGGGGLYVKRVTMDLAGLCRQVTGAAGSVLREIGVAIGCEVPASLLIPGDPQLLQRMMLELISNSARAIGRGEIFLRLRQQGDRAVLSLSDTGDLPSPRQLSAMLEQDTDQGVPMPGQGAGLGMAIVRQIVTLHRGAMLVEWSQGSPAVVISLPISPLEPRTEVNAPALQRDGGMSPLLVALSDLLPPVMFEEDRD